ncbi:hypothetical protein Tco_0153808 [Tanacetum coccineum]
MSVGREEWTEWRAREDDDVREGEREERERNERVNERRREWGENRMCDEMEFRYCLRGLMRERRREENGEESEERELRRECKIENGRITEEKLVEIELENFDERERAEDLMSDGPWVDWWKSEWS